MALRLAQLEADPPRGYPGGGTARELLMEGPAKAHEARRFGVFDTFATKLTDDYRIWRVQSPAYVAPLAGFFRTFGVGRAELRVFSALGGLCGLCALFMLARMHRSPLVATLTCAICVLNYFDIQLIRGALLEPYLNAILCFTFACGLYAQRTLPALVLCQLGFVAAFFSKQTALFALPVLLALTVCAHLAALRRSAPQRQHVFTIASGLVLAGLSIAYIRTPEYWSTVEWNATHMLAGADTHRPVTVAFAVLRVSEVLRRLVDPQRWIDIVFYTIPLAPLAILQVGLVFRSLSRDRKAEPVELLACGWFLCALVALALTERVRPRFSIILLPPTALLAASFLALVRAKLEVSWRRETLFAAAALLVLLTDVRWLGATLGSPTYDLKHAGELLAQKLDSSAVVVGSVAPILAFDTQADLFYVKGPFNTSREAFAGLGATHLLVRPRDGVTQYVKRYFPQVYRARQRVSKLDVLGETCILYRLPIPPAAPLPRADTSSGFARRRDGGALLLEKRMLDDPL